jgi:DNA (cytosine-5)-methyltransferase 1
MTVGSLFAGIGGFDVAAERVGWEVKWQVEIDPFCRRVLEKRWPNVQRFDDVRNCCGGHIRIYGGTHDGRCPDCWTGHYLEPVDVICGGFPCQDISPAGSRVGIDGARSGLWRDYARLVGDLRPRYVVVENSADLLLRGMGRVCGDLAALGYDAEWEVVSACALGAPHTRERVFLVAYPASERPGQLWRFWSEEERAAQRHLHWPTNEPPCERVVTGVPDRSQRVTALGNAIVPQIAEWIFRQIQAAEDAMTAGDQL